MIGFLFYIVLCTVELAGAYFAVKAAPQQKQEPDDPFENFFCN
ncbi:hypothetical protein [Anoxybacteroides tepidamans]|nr:hypothetical protein [Anoxybacillus tepidamans]